MDELTIIPPATPRPAAAAIVAVGRALSNDRHEAFCRALIDGEALADAYVSAYGELVSRNAAWACASRLRARADVRRRLAELQAAADRALMHTQAMAQRLYEIDMRPTPKP